MIANLCLYTCALLMAQTTDRSEWLLAPRLSRGQELFYRGSYQEESLGRGVQFSRSYRLENRVFVMETTPKGTEVAFFTILKLKSTRNEDGEASSLRLEVAHVDYHGRLTTDPAITVNVPLDGPATAEWGAILELPKGVVGLKQSWEVPEVNRPATIWRIVGTDAINGTSCLKIEGLQQSDDWEHPRADRAGWRRREIVWLAPRLGIVYRLERTVERRDPAHQAPTYRSVTQMELQSNLQYPGQFYEDRRRDILQSRKFQEAANPLLPNPTQNPPRAFDVLTSKINHHLENQPPTPYREAVLQVRRRVEAAKRGESPPMSTEGNSVAPTVAALDQRAPDFLVTNLHTSKSARLHDWQDRPIVMLFYSPRSRSADEVLRFAEKVQAMHAKNATVLAFAIGDDVAQAKQQYADLRLTFPLLSGNGLRQTYSVEATPKFVVVDAGGMVRGNFVGWGPETSGAVQAELNQWIHAAAKK